MKGHQSLGHEVNQPPDSTWERVPVSTIAKRVIWRLEQERYALTEGRLYHLGEQLPDYYGGDPRRVGYRRLEQLRGEAAKCFFETDMFFIKVSLFIFPGLAIDAMEEKLTSTTKAIRFSLYRPDRASSPQYQTFDMLLRTSGARICPHDVECPGEMEARSGC